MSVEWGHPFSNQMMVGITHVGNSPYRCVDGIGHAISASNAVRTSTGGTPTGMSRRCTLSRSSLTCSSWRPGARAVLRGGGLLSPGHPLGARILLALPSHIPRACPGNKYNRNGLPSCGHSLTGPGHRNLDPGSSCFGRVEAPTPRVGTDPPDM